MITDGFIISGEARRDDCIFIHIPRTGGRSIHSALSLKFPGDSTHKTIQGYIDILSEPVVRNTFKFTVVRNPWDWMVSLWEIANGCVDDFEYWVRTVHDNDDFITFRPLPMSSNPNQLAQMPSIKTNELYYCKTKDNEILIDKFLRFENLQAEFEKISEKLKVSPTLPTFGNGERNTKDYRELFKTQTTIDIVAEVNKDLISQFGYKF